MCFDTKAFLSLSTVGPSMQRAEIFCEMIARFFFLVDFLQGLYRGSPTRRYNNIRTRGSHIGPFTIGVSFCFAIARRVFLSGRFPTRFVQGQPRNRTEKEKKPPQPRKKENKQSINPTATTGVFQS